MRALSAPSSRHSLSGEQPARQLPSGTASSWSGRADSVPRQYAVMDEDELDRRIIAARRRLGDRLVILGHHYQRDEIIKYADARGDSFKLASSPPDVQKPTTSSSAGFTSWLRAPIS